MTINLELEPELERAVNEAAQRMSSTPEDMVLATLRGKFLPPPPKKHTDEEFQRLLKAVATNCGVSLSNEQLSSEALYD